MEDNYNYAGGCGVKHPFNAVKRAECEKIHLEKKNIKGGNAESDIILAKAALFLMNENASWISGQILGVDGGMGSLRMV